MDAYTISIGTRLSNIVYMRVESKYTMQTSEESFGHVFGFETFSLGSE